MQTKRKIDSYPKRKRPIQIKFYMSEQEYDAFLSQLDDTGMTAQSFILNAIKGTKVVDTDTRKDLRDINANLIGILNQARGMGVNHNQMAKVANTTGQLPTKNELNQMTDDVMGLIKEVQPICQLLSQLIHAQVPEQH